MLSPANGKTPETWTGPQDYVMDLSRLRDLLGRYAHHVERVEYDKHPDLQLSPEDEDFLKGSGHHLDFDGPGENGR
jgi:hypothetical protein